MSTNGGRYLQILSDKDLYKQTIVVSAETHDGVPLTFPARFPNILVDYPLGQIRVGDKLWTNWNKALLKLWQTQLNYVVFCASSACGVTSAHLNYIKHLMIRSVYHFHAYYHVRRILKNYRCLCHTRPVLTQLIILILSQNFLKFARIIGFLTILRNTVMKNFIGLISVA